MAKFQDRKGNEWTLLLTVGAVADVKRDTQVNLALASKDAAWVQAVFSGDGKLAEILWVLCEEEAKSRGLTPEAFAHLLDGTTLEAAGTALAEAIADFFPRSAVAQAVRRGLPRLLEAADRTTVAAIDRAVETAIQAATGPASSTASPSPTSAPASAESAPAG